MPCDAMAALLEAAGIRLMNKGASTSHGGGNRHGQPARQTQLAETGRNRRAVLLGFVVGIFGYLLLSFQQPAGWGEGLWAALALLLVPALAGLVVHRAQAKDRPLGSAFLAGMKSAGWAMLFYASITLIVLASRLGAADGGEQRLLAGLLVTCIYTLLAGVVAGLVNLALTRVAGRTNSHGTAP